MSIDDLSGDKLIPAFFETRRWQHQFFVEIRKSTLYRKTVFPKLQSVWEESGRFIPAGVFETPDHSGPTMLEMLDRYSISGVDVGQAVPFFQALKQAACALHLVRYGDAAAWAVNYLYADCIGAFDPDRPQRTLRRPSARTLTIDICESIADCDRMMIGDAEWEKLEQTAVAAARQAVVDIRDGYLRPAGLAAEYAAMMKVRAGHQKGHNLRIKKLAQRLAGWKAKSDWNSQRTDKRWCERIGIDPPKK